MELNDDQVFKVCEALLNMLDVDRGEWFNHNAIFMTPTLKEFQSLLVSYGYKGSVGDFIKYLHDVNGIEISWEEIRKEFICREELYKPFLTNIMEDIRNKKIDDIIKN